MGLYVPDQCPQVLVQPLVAVIDQLLPHLYVDVGDVEIAQRSLFHLSFGDELGEEGDAYPSLQQAHDEIGASQLQYRLDLQVQLGQCLLQRAAIGDALLGEDEGGTHQIPHRQRSCLGIGRGGTGDEVHLHRLFLGDHVLPIIHVAVEGDDEIHLVAGEQTEHRLGVGIDEFQGYVGMKAMEIGIVGADHILAHRVGSGDAQKALLSALALGELLGKVADLPGVIQQIPSPGGEGDGVADPLEEQAIQLVFQLFDLEGDGRLGVIQRLCGLGEAAQLGNLHECDEISYFHKVSFLELEWQNRLSLRRGGGAHFFESFRPPFSKGGAVEGA